MSALFVHLSDIHFGQERDGGVVVVNADVRRRLLDDAEARVRAARAAASGIIVTGDIAYFGKAAEYAAAGEWLDGHCQTNVPARS